MHYLNYVMFQFDFECVKVRHHWNKRFLSWQAPLFWGRHKTRLPTSKARLEICSATPEASMNFTFVPSQPAIHTQ